MNKVRHVLGISGGKDSAALAIYMKQNYPQLDIEYIHLIRVKSSTKPTN
jgi:tRNA(Ile)-lysidine synthase TilS/MesJ